MIRKWCIGLLGCSLWFSVAPCYAQDLRIAVKRLEDRLNQRAMHVLLGAVDYEFAYVPAAYEDKIIFLEETGRIDKSATQAQMRTLSPDARKSLRQAGLRGAGIQDTVTIDGTAHIRVQVKSEYADSVWNEEFVSTSAWEDYLVQRGQAQLQKRLNAAQARKDALPLDVRQADLAALKQRLSYQNESAGPAMFLGVRDLSADSSDTGERLTLAEEKLSPMDRRALRWDMRQIYNRWPSGSRLVLRHEPITSAETPQNVPIDWSFRRIGSPPDYTPDILASGQVDLTFQQRDGAWKVEQIEALIAAIHNEIVESNTVRRTRRNK